MKAEEFDKKFDDGDDVSRHLDLSKARRPVQEQKRVNVDVSLWMIHLLVLKNKSDFFLFLGSPYVIPSGWVLLNLDDSKTVFT